MDGLVINPTLFLKPFLRLLSEHVETGYAELVCGPLRYVKGPYEFKTGMTVPQKAIVLWPFSLCHWRPSQAQSPAVQFTSMHALRSI